METKEIPTNLNKIYKTVEIKIKELERPKLKMKDIFVGVKGTTKKQNKRSNNKRSNKKPRRK